MIQPPSYVINLKCLEFVKQKQFDVAGTGKGKLNSAMVAIITISLKKSHCRVSEGL